MIEPAFERQQRRLAGVAGAFRKDDEGCPAIECSRHQSDGIVPSALPVAVNEDGVKDIAAYEPPKLTFQPVVRCRDWSRALPQSRRQHRPDQDEVAMAGMVGEIDPLAGDRLTTFPLTLHGGDEARKPDEQSCNELRKHLGSLGSARAIFAHAAFVFSAVVAG